MVVSEQLQVHKTFGEAGSRVRTRGNSLLRFKIARSPAPAAPETEDDLALLAQMLLAGEGQYYVNRVRKLLAGVAPARLSDFVLEIDHYLFKLVVYFLRLFRREEAIEALINDPRFSTRALERIVVYLHYNLMVRYEEEEPESCLLSLPPLRQERIFDLLATGAYVPRDRALSMLLMGRLDRKSLDRLVREMPEPMNFLGDLVRGFPEEQLRSFLCKNPDLFGYLKAFFSIGNPDPGIQNILVGHQQAVEETVRTLQRARRLQAEHPPGSRDVERIAAVLRELRASNDPVGALEVLEERDFFEDEREKQIVKNVLLNPQFADILGALPDFSEEELALFEGEDLVFF